LIFVLMGFLCGVSGVALASYVGYGTIAAGTGYKLDAIAACILGGPPRWAEWAPSLERWSGLSSWRVSPMAFK
jgi:hypothetical protein